MPQVESNNVSLAAMIVAVVALVIASGQFLQQVFGTADGYRRCQSSVIGPWSRNTRLRWRWKEFRFETLLTTPEIIVLEDADENPHCMNNKYIPMELRLTLQRVSSKDSFSRDHVTWMLSLRQIFEQQQKYYVPAIQKQGGLYLD